MKLIHRLVFAVVLPVQFIAVAAPKSKVTPPAKPDPIAVAHERLKDVLKDPESARFRGDFRGKDGAICGFVNSKNSYGGYVGFHRYVVQPDNILIEGDASQAWMMDSRWLDYCADFEPTPASP
jgi:hypothetical protein